jgi:UDP-glucose:(heptosyl)LPS alpha-1,3-glucosyltransferase
MKIGLCYPSVLPARGGCETYITDLARRLVEDRHDVHLFACRWDATALPDALQVHALPDPRGPRFLKPWRFAALCEQALQFADIDVSLGFDKTWGQDVLYPQGGLHKATVAHNLNKYSSRFVRELARLGKSFDLAHWSFTALERRQYLSRQRPLVVVNSNMVRGHFQYYYGAAAADLRVIRSAVDPSRFAMQDRPKRRAKSRQDWGIAPGDSVALFVAMNYRLKGLGPLLHAVRLLPRESPFRLVVVGNRKTAPFEQLAQRLGVVDRVLFLGPRRDVHNCYFAADFLVHPTFYDPCSLVILEATACGLPVITSCYNGASELLHPPQDGYVIGDPHDHARLAWAMEQLFDPGRRAACAAVARRTALEWTFEHHYRRLLEVLQEAAARRKAA